MRGPARAVITLASRNQHKIIELTELAPFVEWRPLPADAGDPPETGATFVANALQKARYASAFVEGWVLADDSGLEVDGLGGRPGVFSKRYSPSATDEANNTLLLHELSLQLNRRARYRCVLALVGPAGEQVVSGSCEGHIGLISRGAGGFGYDPLFWPDLAPGHTMAELSREDKGRISHRGAAMRALMPILARL